MSDTQYKTQANDVPPGETSRTTGKVTIDVSVVIPTHGRPDLLRRAIFSALSQTASNLEVIVVLDGHDPATLAAVGWIKDPRLSLVNLIPAVGGSEARNTGAFMARGRYIALLDDDDEWMPDKLAKQLALAEVATTDTFVVVTQYLYRVSGRSDEIWPGHLPQLNEPLSEFLFSSRGGFQTSTYLCPTSLFRRCPFTFGLKKHQDWDWFLRLASIDGFKLLVVPEPLSIYWTPLRTRSGVSGKLDWRFSAAWARSRRSLMTRRAYSTFLVKICLRGAFIQKERLQSLAILSKELFLVGRPSAPMMIDFVASVLIPETLRMRLRYGMMRLRRNSRAVPA